MRSKNFVVFEPLYFEWWKISIDIHSTYFVILSVDVWSQMNKFVECEIDKATIEVKKND